MKIGITYSGAGNDFSEFRNRIRPQLFQNKIGKNLFKYFIINQNLYHFKGSIHWNFCTIKAKRLILFLVLLYLDPKQIIPDPDPGKHSGSKRIRIHSTDFKPVNFSTGRASTKWGRRCLRPPTPPSSWQSTSGRAWLTNRTVNLLFVSTYRMSTIAPHLLL